MKTRGHLRIRSVVGMAGIVWMVGATAATAAVDMFLKIGDIKGESTDRDHKDWIIIDSFSHGITRGATYGQPGVERSDHADFVLTKQIDKASPKLALAVCSGQKFTSATLVVRPQTVSPVAMPASIEIHLEDVIISGWDLEENKTLGGEALPMEEVSFNYGKIKWVYRQINPDTGGIVETVATGWDAAGDQPALPIDQGRSLWLH